MNIKTLSFGCRLNAMECDKIKDIVSNITDCAIIVNTCAVTNEAERQSGQAIRKISRENPDAPIFVTGCAATRNPALFSEIPNVLVIDNKDKMRIDAYYMPCHIASPKIAEFKSNNGALSKQFVQIQNGCGHFCTYCVTRLLRGQNVSFRYEDILKDVQNSVKNGFYEIVLTGVDIASFELPDMKLYDLCAKLLQDIPEIQRLRLSSIDPASLEIPKIVELMKREPRMMPHMHLSMQSGSNTILAAMKRRHNADMVRRVTNHDSRITFSWDIICGFPGETEELFNETLALVRELKPIKIHAFPFSPRPGTEAAILPNRVNQSASKSRVKIISDAADDNKREFMKTKLGTVAQVLVEEKNRARTPDDIEVIIQGEKIRPRTICNVKLIDISDLHFIAKVVKYG